MKTWTEKAKASFWSKVDQSAGADACWPWTLSKSGNGYGQVNMGKSHGPCLRAHRVAYMLTNGNLPAFSNADSRGTVVMHSCDNRLCCNPKHLRAGTQSENLKDMHSKGRLVSTPRMTKEQARRAAAYPRLVDALRELIQALDAGTRPMTNQPFSSVSGAISILANIEVHARTSIVPARALLRSFGEDA